jgi:phage-related protein
MAAIFPLLSSGAVVQYPAAVVTGQNVQAIRFLDGSDQRYLQQGRQFRSWQIKLNLLNETELARLEAFFIQQQGDYLTFSFPDPFSGVVVPNCRLGAPGIAGSYVGVDTGAATLWVIETNG